MLGASLLGGFAACSGDPEVARDPGIGGAGGSAGTGGSEGGLCIPGQFRCEGNVARRCETGGGLGAGTDCQANGAICSELLGCVDCVPGAATSCKDGVGSCAAGRQRLEFDCDPTQGMTVRARRLQGRVRAARGDDQLHRLRLLPDRHAQPGLERLRVRGRHRQRQRRSRRRDHHARREHRARAADRPGALEVVPLDVGAGAQGRRPGRVPASRPRPARRRWCKDGAYRLRSNQPVTVYQLSPLQYQLDSPTTRRRLSGRHASARAASCRECLSYSNDASLLLPATALTGDYTVMSWPSRGNDRARFFAVTATPGRHPRRRCRDAAASARARGVDARGHAADHARPRRRARGAREPRRDDSDDASGSPVRARQAGAGDRRPLVREHPRLRRPPPAITWKRPCSRAKRSAPIPTWRIRRRSPASRRTCCASPRSSPTPDHVRARGVSDPITLGPDDPRRSELAGVSSDFKVTASAADPDRPVHAGPDLGAERRRRSVDVARGAHRAVPQRVSVHRVDHLRLELRQRGRAQRRQRDARRQRDRGRKFTPIGSCGYGVARVELSPTEVHTIDSARPFGLVVYGYGLYTSYMYPGGLDLKRISPPPIF